MQMYKPLAGEDISVTAAVIVALAHERNERVRASFNEIELTADPDSDPKAIVTEYHTQVHARHEAWLASPEGQEAERRREEAVARAAEEQAKPLAAFSVRDADAWQAWIDSNQDDYGACCLRYAARWAALMEARMAVGNSLEAIAESTSHEANTEGITGFMYGCAVQMLAKVWEHGEALRRWHNLDTQIKDEGERANESGGVLNPAMLKIG